jgi:hypothetical protein
MWRGVRWYLFGFIALAALGALAACSGGGFLAEREPWRKEAEARCIGSGAVPESAGIVRINPINGPGMCGAAFPLKVSSIGMSGAVGYVDEFRPPGSIPNASQPALPRWPIAEPPAAPARPLPTVQSRPLPPPPGGPAYDGMNSSAPPVSLEPPPAAASATYEPYDFRRPYGANAPSPTRAPARASAVEQASPVIDMSPEPYEQRRTLDDQRRMFERPRTPSRYEPVPRSEPPPTAPARQPRRREAAPLGPSRMPQVAGATAAVKFSPPATLACPLVAVVDQWIHGTIQPASMRWFGVPVVEIRQISAYSCRGMNGNPNARISEHAFGNALDVASFTLADGRRVTVKNGWKGSPEEQGFLRDVQAGACDRFNTVLAPGSNRFHYDHFHVDLMRRANGRRACNPAAVSGEEVAARARGTYARRGGDPSVTGSVRRGAPTTAPTAFTEEKSGHILPAAVPGEDGED